MLLLSNTDSSGPGSIGDFVLCSVKKGVQKLRKKVNPVVIIRQRRQRPDGTFIYCEDYARVIVNNTGETEGSFITGPVAKETSKLWPKIS